MVGVHFSYERGHGGGGEGEPVGGGVDVYLLEVAAWFCGGEELLAGRITYIAYILTSYSAVS